MTIYLAPHDYHRIHMPFDGKILDSRLIEGDLWPVNRQSVRTIPELFCVNERWISRISTSRGECALIMVGATNVGGMELVHLNGCGKEIMKGTRYFPHDPVYEAQKGAWYGSFHMGSTVILLFDASFSETISEDANKPRNLRCRENLC